MAATQTVGRGLSPDDLTRIRDTLAAGRKPKVVFTAAAGQIAGQAGQVVALTDPDVSDEWVVVRFGRDELPFSPGDLAVPTKTLPARVETPPTSKITSSRPAPAAVPGPREEPPVPPSPARKTAAPAASAAPAKVASAKAAPAKAEDPPPAPAPVVAKVEDKPAEKDERRPARKAAKPKAVPSLTVTVTYADGDWMVGATQGSRALAKPYVIKAADALKMVALLDVASVHEAVEQIVESARAEAQRQAERLRAELAEVEARLAELHEAS